MNCPVDNTPLVMSERQGIEIDYCPQCRGVWLDRGELDKIIERSASELSDYPEPDSGRDRERERDQGGHGRGGKKRRGSFLGELFGD